MSFTDQEINDWKKLYSGAVSHDQKWKRVPASDGRLRAMAAVISRGDLHPHEWTNAIAALSPSEKERFETIKKELEVSK